MQRVWKRALLVGGGALLGVQAATVGVLAGIAELRKRRAPPAQFPHNAEPVGTVDGNAARVFTYGQNVYEAMIAAIEGAQRCVYLETFIFKGDALGQRFKEALERKAAEGVAVFVVFDGVANLVVPPAFKRFRPPVHALEYRTVDRVWHALDPRRYAREHRKLLVVDEESAFIGGYNIGQLYATEWRDTHLQLQGAAARELAAAFVAFWNQNRGSGPALQPPAQRPWPQAIVVQRNDPARLVFPIRGMYLDAFDRAQSHIYLTNAYFIPDRAVLGSLEAAAQRGVDVRVLVPWQSNHVTADWLARGFFDGCLRAGVRVFGYQHAMIHAKTATVDGVWSTIGTANLDRLSLAGNYEINVEIRDAAFAAEMERVFATDLTNALELSRDTWEARPWYSKAGELVLSPLRPLL